MATARSALITGIAGQDGSYLAELLLSKGYRVAGTVRRLTDERPAALAQLGAQLQLFELDVRDRSATSSVVARASVDEVYHLAAQSRVGASWEDPWSTAEVSGMGALHVLDAVRAIEPNARPRLLVAGSSEVYGRAASTPLTEEAPHAPISPYGAAKSFAQRMTTLYRDHYGLFAATAILFNHESPRRSAHFVSRKIAAGAVAIQQGRADRLQLGNVDVVRDWGFAGDVVDAMWRMLQADRPDDFVIGTGVGHSVRQLAEAAFRVVGLEAGRFVTVDDSLLRRDDAPFLVADPSRARTRLGWTSSVDFEQLVRMLVVAEQAHSSH